MSNDSWKDELSAIHGCKKYDFAIKASQQFEKDTSDEIFFSDDGKIGEGSVTFKPVRIKHKIFRVKAFKKMNSNKSDTSSGIIVYPTFSFQIFEFVNPSWYEVERGITSDEIDKYMIKLRDVVEAQNDTQ